MTINEPFQSESLVMNRRSFDIITEVCLVSHYYKQVCKIMCKLVTHNKQAAVHVHCSPSTHLGP